LRASTESWKTRLTPNDFNSSKRKLNENIPKKGSWRKDFAKFEDELEIEKVRKETQRKIEQFTTDNKNANNLGKHEDIKKHQTRENITVREPQKILRSASPAYVTINLKVSNTSEVSHEGKQGSSEVHSSDPKTETLVKPYDLSSSMTPINMKSVENHEETLKSSKIEEVSPAVINNYKHQNSNPPNSESGDKCVIVYSQEYKLSLNNREIKAESKEDPKDSTNKSDDSAQRITVKIDVSEPKKTENGYNSASTKKDQKSTKNFSVTKKPEEEKSKLNKVIKKPNHPSETAKKSLNSTTTNAETSEGSKNNRISIKKTTDSIKDEMSLKPKSFEQVKKPLVNYDQTNVELVTEPRISVKTSSKQVNNLDDKATKPEKLSSNLTGKGSGCKGNCRIRAGYSTS
jgi:hypothetical protein